MARKCRDAARVQKLSAAVIANLTPDLVKDEFKFLQRKSLLGGHCYVASEAMYYLLGARNSEYMPASIVHEGVKHYYLKHRVTGAALDLTAAQFATPVPYEKGRGMAYRQSKASKRAAIVIERVNARKKRK